MWRATIQVGSQTQMPGKLDGEQSVYCVQWQDLPKLTGQKGLVTLV